MTLDSASLPASSGGVPAPASEARAQGLAPVPDSDPARSLARKFAALRVGGAKKLHNVEKREQRSAFAVSAYVGANGGGKTACMVWDCIPSLEKGRPVLSTVRILDYTDPRSCDDPVCAENPERLDHFMMRPTAEGQAAAIRNQRALFLDPYAKLETVEMQSIGVHKAAHPGWIPWTTWEQLLAQKFGEVLADEMTGIAEARGAMSLPNIVIDQFQQLRRDDIPFRYTLPAWEQADVSMRRPTQSVTVCSGRWKVQAPADGERERVWRAARLFRWRTYDAMRLTEMTEGKLSELEPEVTDWHWGPDSPAWKAYDTFAPVLRVGAVNSGGRCHKCGGTRRAPQCPGHEGDDAVTIGGQAVDVGGRRRLAVAE